MGKAISASGRMMEMRLRTVAWAVLLAVVATHVDGLPLAAEEAEGVVLLDEAVASEVQPSAAKVKAAEAKAISQARGIAKKIHSKTLTPGHFLALAKRSARDNKVEKTAQKTMKEVRKKHFAKVGRDAARERQLKSHQKQKQDAAEQQSVALAIAQRAKIQAAKANQVAMAAQKKADQKSTKASSGHRLGNAQDTDKMKHKKEYEKKKGPFKKKKKKKKKS